MLSDDCFELQNQITRAAYQALDDFEEAFESVDNEIYNYPAIVMQTLRLAISDLRGDRLKLVQFLQITEMVRVYFDDSNNLALDTLIKQFESVLGENYWLRWQ